MPLNTKSANRKTCGLVILAAGGSTRMGQPKQLLHYQDKALLQNAIDIATDTNTSPRVLVLGANAATIEEQVDTKNIHTAYNDTWKDGMASSIKCGLLELLSINPYIQGALFIVCDQPFISSLLLNAMVASADSGKGIIACRYENTLGTPVLFNKKYFTQLTDLDHREGAKKIINNNPNDVHPVTFPLGNIDIDTTEDYQHLLQKVCCPGFVTSISLQLR
jgi:molybdenum cofactor cytidylyltransferase